MLIPCAAELPELLESEDLSALMGTAIDCLLSPAFSLEIFRSIINVLSSAHIVSRNFSSFEGRKLISSPSSSKYSVDPVAINSMVTEPTAAFATGGKRVLQSAA